MIPNIIAFINYLLIAFLISIALLGIGNLLYITAISIARQKPVRELKGFFDIPSLIVILADFLMVVVTLELAETLLVFVEAGKVVVSGVIEAAIVALCRRVIALAVLIIALSLTYFTYTYAH